METGILNDGSEGVQCQAGSPDEGSIDIGPSQESRDGVWCDASSVEDSHGGGDGFSMTFFEKSAREVVDGLGLIRGRGFAGTDGPDRFVGQDDLVETVGSDFPETGFDLIGNDRFGLARFPLFESLSNAEDGRESRLDGRGDLAGRLRVGFTELVTTFRVTYESQLASQCGDHR